MTCPFNFPGYVFRSTFKGTQDLVATEEDWAAYQSMQAITALARSRIKAICIQMCSPERKLSPNKSINLLFAAYAVAKSEQQQIDQSKDNLYSIEYEKAESLETLLEGLKETFTIEGKSLDEGVASSLDEGVASSLKHAKQCLEKQAKINLEAAKVSIEDATGMYHFLLTMHKAKEGVAKAEVEKIQKIGNEDSEGLLTLANIEQLRTKKNEAATAACSSPAATREAETTENDDSLSTIDVKLIRPLIAVCFLVFLYFIGLDLKRTFL